MHSLCSSCTARSRHRKHTDHDRVSLVACPIADVLFDPLFHDRCSGSFFLLQSSHLPQHSQTHLLNSAYMTWPASSGVWSPVSWTSVDLFLAQNSRDFAFLFANSASVPAAATDAASGWAILLPEAASLDRLA